MGENHRVRRVQVNRLFQLINEAAGTQLFKDDQYIPRDILLLLSKATIMQEVTIYNKKLKVTPSMISLSELLLGKI